jgi:dinuclear metal center YbgI/SA1388 family protein
MSEAAHTGVPLDEIAAHLDTLLATASTPDYPQALNGVQLAHRGPVTRVACAVDVSQRTIAGAVDAGANLLIVHHGMFWSGAQRLVGRFYDRLATLMAHDIAVYSAHLPLDAHATLGNSKLLADHLGLAVTGGFAQHKDIFCGVRGETEQPTAELQQRVAAFSAQHGHTLVSTPIADGRVTRRWAICSGAGAGHDTLREAQQLGIDTLIVGEGPHWSAVDAEDMGLVLMYAGHYATETLGVQAVGRELAQRFGLPWTFIAAPTGL